MAETNYADKQMLYRLLTELSAQATNPATRGRALDIVGIWGSVQNPRIESSLISKDGRQIHYCIEDIDNRLYLALSLQSYLDFGGLITDKVLIPFVNKETVSLALAQMNKILTTKQVARLPVYLLIRQAIPFV